MTIIDDNTVVVFTSDELKNALENNNNYTYIYFGSNITLTSGINISSYKTNVTIDGTYQNIRYQLEDMKSLSASNTIAIASEKTLNVTVKNIDIIGYNYYGVIYVRESTSFKNVTVEYNNIKYLGPQISFHPNGITRFIDSNITIETSYATGNEVAECNKIELGGNTTIIHKSTGNSSFWFRNADPYLKVLKNSNVNFTSENRELIYGVTNLYFEIEENSVFNVTTHNGLSYGTNGTGTTIINENSSFTLKQTSTNGSYSTWYSYGTITLNQNSSLYIINNYTGITTSNYNIYFSGSNTGFNLLNPKEVILYNTTANIIYASGTSNFDFKFSRINLFNTSIQIDSNISLSTLPTYSWYKTIDISEITGTFTSTLTTIKTNNFSSQELEELPALSNFIFPNKKILSIGKLPFYMSPLTDTDTIMSGITEANSSILIQYDNTNEVVTSDSNGKFSYNYSTPLPIGTIITLNVKKQNSLIYQTKKIQIVFSGELIIDEITKEIKFSLNPISTNPIICPRSNQVIIKIIDSRVNSSNWKLYASINHDLASEDNKVLKDSLVFIDQDSNINTLSENKTLIYTGENNNGEVKITNVDWQNNEGILLLIKDVISNNTTYEATITWTIEE